MTHGSAQIISILQHAGTYLAVSACVAWVIYRATGHLEAGGWGLMARRTVKQAIPTTLAALLGWLAILMQ